MPMFDPNTGKVLDRDALLSLQFNGKGITVPRTKVINGKKYSDRLNGDTGEPIKNGVDLCVEHPSGQVDQMVKPDMNVASP